MNKDELEALPVGSVVLDRDCDMWVKVLPGDLPGPRWAEVSHEPTSAERWVDEKCDLLSRPLPKDAAEVADRLEPMEVWARNEYDDMTEADTLARAIEILEGEA